MNATAEPLTPGTAPEASGAQGSGALREWLVWYVGVSWVFTILRPPAAVILSMRRYARFYTTPAFAEFLLRG